MRDTRFLTIAAVLLMTICAAIVMRSTKNKVKTADTITSNTDVQTTKEVRDYNGEVIHAKDPSTTIYKPSTSETDLNKLYENMGANDNTTTTKSSKDAGKTVASAGEFTEKGGDITPAKKVRPAVEIIEKPVILKPKPTIKADEFTEKGETIDRKKSIAKDIPSNYDSREKYLIEGYLVTVGAFSSNESVMRQIENLRTKGFDQANFGKFEFAPNLKVVYAGKFDNEASAKSLVKQLQKKGFKEAAVKKRS
jgi:cell division septation protein DedD